MPQSAAKTAALLASPDDIEALNKAATRLHIWKSIESTIKWARLYGGALVPAREIEPFPEIDRCRAMAHAEEEQVHVSRRCGWS